MPACSISSARGSAASCLFGWSIALYYHLCNGLRHLWWDSGRGLELPQVYAGGWMVLAATVVLTVVTWIIAVAHWSV